MTAIVYFIWSFCSQTRQRYAINRGTRLSTVPVGLHNLALAALVDDDLLRGLASSAAVLLDRTHNIHALDDLAEDDVLAVEPAGLGGAEEELGAVAERGVVSYCSGSA